MEVQTDSERVRLSRKMVLEFLGSSVDLSLAGPARRTARSPPTWPATARTRPASGHRRQPAAAGERDAHEAGHHHAPGGDEAAGGDRRPADEGRQRPVRPRLLEVHPLLQVRRGLRRGRPEHVRDRGRRARLRCPDLDGAGRPAARVRVRLLRQLHRRLPDGRADVQARVRHARRRHLGRVAQTVTDTICPYCGVGCVVELHVQDERDREGHLAARLVGDRRPPVHQGPLRLRVRQ